MVVIWDPNPISPKAFLNEEARILLSLLVHGAHMHQSRDTSVDQGASQVMEAIDALANNKFIDLDFAKGAPGQDDGFPKALI